GGALGVWILSILIVLMLSRQRFLKQGDI
ncbi:MAG: GlyGly-CTERM sorting domain-containing protein, partial [Pseudomonadales bacterium]|nr:GlyGly-CTERM sorting domain-containing protein [Pseudomonadales bacterium]